MVLFWFSCSISISTSEIFKWMSSIKICWYLWYLWYLDLLLYLVKRCNSDSKAHPDLPKKQRSSDCRFKATSSPVYPWHPLGKMRSKRCRPKWLDGGTRPARFGNRFGNTGETRIMSFCCGKQPAKMRHILDGIKSQKAEELVTGWFVELSCGMLILEVVYTP